MPACHLHDLTKLLSQQKIIKRYFTSEDLTFISDILCDAHLLLIDGESENQQHFSIHFYIYYPLSNPATSFNFLGSDFII